MASYNSLGRVKLVKSMVTIVLCMVVGFAYISSKNYSKFLKHRVHSRSGRDAFSEDAEAINPGKLPLGESVGRQLLVVHMDVDEDDDKNCTERGINKFPGGVFTNEQRRNGAIVVNFLVSIYLCGAIGYVCAAYFVPSLEIMCDRLNLQPDVAGATFMAAGSSAPELFSAVIGTFISNDDTGMSAIVGSAAFNIFVIISLCCFFAGQELVLHWWPFCRDCFVYVISILLMVVVIYDSKVYWWEGLILSCGYIVYIAIMYFNPYLSEKAEELAVKWKARKERKNAGKGSSDTVGLLSEDPNGLSYGSTYNEAQTGNGELSNHYGNGVLPDYESAYIPGDGDLLGKPQRVTSVSSVISDHPSLADHDPHVFTLPSTWFFTFLYVLGFPAILLTFLTVPDCRKRGLWRRLYFFTFVISTAWLAGLAYILYWMIVVIGYTLDIPDTVMGITLLAGGTSVPDAIASMLVARDGYGDMALSNIIGSNIFEVFICLGLLWFIYGVTFGESVEIASEGLLFTTIALLLTVAFILLAIHINGWKLDMKMGIICAFVYVFFISIAVVWELGLISGIDVPVFCPGPT